MPNIALELFGRRMTAWCRSWHSEPALDENHCLTAGLLPAAVREKCGKLLILTQGGQSQHITPVTRSFEHELQLGNGMKKIAFAIILVILTFLAISAGITKVVLMQRDVDFFGRYGFSDAILIVYGTVQLIGGFLLPFNKTRFVGAAIVAITFLVSLVVLLMDGNIPVSIVTIVMTLLLGVVMKQSWKTAQSQL